MSNNDDLAAAMRFCYALLASGQDANLIIASNPDRAKAAHRAIYNTFGKETPYDTMMADIIPLDPLK